MIYFYEAGERVVAKNENDDGSHCVIGWCDSRPETASNWVLSRDEKMNEVCRIVFTQALAAAYLATEHAAVIRDLFNNHASTMGMED